MAITKWASDPTHSELGFKIKHLMISNVSGSFSKFEVKAATEGDDFTKAKVTVNIDVDSISTNNEQRDQHLRNADFFETEKHPQIVFKSTSIEKESDDEYILHGELTVREVTKPITLKVEYSGIVKDPWGNQRAGFTVSGKMNRKDWGINYNAVLETGGLTLGEEVKVNAEIQMVKESVAVEQ